MSCEGESSAISENLNYLDSLITEHVRRKVCSYKTMHAHRSPAFLCVVPLLLVDRSSAVVTMEMSHPYYNAK